MLAGAKVRGTSISDSRFAGRGRAADHAMTGGNHDVRHCSGSAGVGGVASPPVWQGARTKRDPLDRVASREVTIEPTPPRRRERLV